MTIFSGRFQNRTAVITGGASGLGLETARRIVAEGGRVSLWDRDAGSVARAGAGIGGEYTAINSTIQEFVPARYRGWTDLVINGSFWIGAALGAGGAIVLLNPSVIAPELGWRIAFFIGAALGLVILLMRLWLPESPRWLVIHGRATEADRILDDIETQIEQHGAKLSPPQRQPMQIQPRSHTPLRELAHALLHTHRRRTMLGLALMIAQAFFYNAIFFTYALVLTRFQGVRSEDVGWYILPFAAGNVLGPLLLGRLFDTLGRRIMITATYGISGLLLAVVALLFARGDLGAAGMTAGWTLVFFFASPAASAAYLTVSESFPLEVRALAIAIFYAIGTAIGGVAAPYLLGRLIETGERSSVLYGYLGGAALMLVAAAVAWRLAHAAERRSLEEVAAPLSSR